MQFVDKYRWPIIAGIIVVLLGVTLYLGGNKDTDKADSNKESSQTAEQKQAEEQKAKEEAAKTGETTVTAAEGDSYTVLSRHAVAQYAKDAGVTVTPAQAVAAETFLTQDANAPELEVGQKVTVNKADVANAVKKAQALSADEQAAWEVYVPYVDFNA
ncbi:hypothetical protein KC949_01610 [Candidatus Saccharibacteria bacterium]|nr:hypothetical protein [Candidatus Saccharibacteria bacterium]